MIKKKSNESNYTACFAVNSSSSTGIKPDQETCSMNGFGGSRGIIPVFNDEEGVFRYDYIKKEKHELTDGTYRLTKLVEDSLDYGSYYIKTKGNDKIFGPYSSTERAYFSSEEFIGNSFSIYNNRIFTSEISEMFYEKSDGGYKIWSADGTKCFDEIFDTATPISNNAMKVEKDGKVGVINENMELVLFGDFEDVSNVINNRALVKINGEWKLIRVISRK